MKKLFAMLLAMLLFAASAYAEGSMLLVELPQDALMVEDVAFDDGDFIQTYQLGDGARVQLVRYASFDMTLGDLIASEWVGATDVFEIGVNEIGGCPAQGLRFSFHEAGQEALDVTLVVVDAGETLVFSAVYPQALGAKQIDAAVEAMLASMSVMEEGTEPVDSTAEVG